MKTVSVWRKVQSFFERRNEPMPAQPPAADDDSPDQLDHFGQQVLEYELVRHTALLLGCSFPDAETLGEEEITYAVLVEQDVDLCKFLITAQCPIVELVKVPIGHKSMLSAIMSAKTNGESMPRSADLVKLFIDKEIQILQPWDVAVAAKENEDVFATLLAARLVDLSWRDDNHNTLLYYAVIGDKLETFSSLVRDNVSLYNENFDGLSPFIVACLGCSRNILQNRFAGVVSGPYLKLAYSLAATAFLYKGDMDQAKVFSDRQYSTSEFDTEHAPDFMSAPPVSDIREKLFDNICTFYNFNEFPPLNQ